MTMMRKPSMIMLIVLSVALDTCACANQQHLERQLQHYGSGKRVQTKSIKTESIQTESIQIGTARTMACTEI
jgi:hypothetical protein